MTRVAIVDFRGTLATRPTHIGLATLVHRVLKRCGDLDPGLRAAIVVKLKARRDQLYAKDQELSFADDLAQVAARAGRIAPNRIAAAVEEVFEETGDGDLFAGAQATLVTLKSRGYTLALFSNTFRPFRFRMRSLQHLGVLDLFDHVETSSNLGIRKPSRCAFQSILSLLNATPGDSVSIGDSMAKDIVPARRLGLQTLLVDNKPEGSGLPIGQVPNAI